jgi:hypothetical protein
MNSEKRSDAMNTNQMRVILGVSSLKAYVTAPKAFHVLGIVRFGMEYGLLATNEEGLYFRVNGSQVEALSSSAVRRAIDMSYGVGGRLSAGTERYLQSHPNATPPITSPKVIIRKHRQVPLSAMQQPQQRGMQSSAGA